MGNSASDLSVRFLSGCPEIPPTPAAPEVQRQFDEVLQWKQVTPELAAELNSMESIETKWMYVFLNKLARVREGQQEWLEPHQCVQQVERLHDEMAPISDLLRAVRINILLRDSVWGDQFLGTRGLSALVALLQTDKATAPIVPGEILNVLFVLMCHEGGTAALIRESNLLSSLLGVFQSTSLRTLKARVLRLLTIVCHHGASGHAAVLGALENGKDCDGHRFRLFESHQDGDPALLLAVTKLLEALAVSSVASPKRKAMPDELSDAGAVSFLERIQSGSLKPNDPDTDAVLTTLAASIMQTCTDTRPADASTAAETPFAKVSEESGKVTYHVDLTEAPSSPTDRRERSVDMRSASKFKLHIPGASGGFGSHASTKSPQKASKSPRKGSKNAVMDAAQLPQVLSQLQQHSQQLDQETSAKLTGLLAQISASLADAKTSVAKGVVDMLEQSLSRHGKSPNKVSPQRRAGDVQPASASPQSTGPDSSQKRVKFALLADNFDTPAEDEPNGERVASEARTESVDESSGSPVEATSESRRRTNIKLTLPLFQSFRKGPGLGATPACTPIATASVRKDAKRHVFPSHVSDSLFVLEEVSPDPASRTVSREACSSALPSLPLLPTSIPDVEAQDTKVAPGTAPPPSGGDLSKFRKLLAMGAPRDAVRAKMQQAGVDPDLLDEEKQGFAPSVRINSSASTTVTARATVGASAESVPTVDISKFRKLLSMGAPMAAVKAKMMQAGVDPSLLDQQEVTAVQPPPAPLAVEGTASTGSSDVSKFKKLLAMGAPLAAVKAKMVQAGLDPALLDGPAAATPVVATRTLVKDDPEYAKFFKLLSMGAPPAAVKAKMTQAGLNPALLDTPEAEMPSSQPETSNTATSAPVEAPLKVKDHPDYAKFFKLLSMGAPNESVKAKIRMAGLNPDLLDTPDADMPGATSAPAAVKVKDDPNYAKFFKLLAMNAPMESVKAKMRMAGLNADVLDTPEAILSAKNTPTTAAGGAGVAAPVGRRAHLTLAIPPPVKQMTRPFYWQHLRGDAIKGTVWEEIDRESSNQSNQVPLVLSDSDLAVLESEFPPPNKDGPVTGGRQRSGSLDLGPMSPGSPLASPRVVFLIDRSRANNISIIVKQFRVSNAALREAIMKVDTSVLNLERVQGLIKILPTEEEMAAISAFQGDPMTLNEAERILKELMTVPRLKQRLASLLATLQFPGLVRDLEEKVEKVRNASTEVSESVEFKSVLQVVLQVGNKMNLGTNRGNAKGFRLGDLTKLAQLKSADRSVTLLHYVARMMRHKKGNMVHLSDSLPSLYSVQNVPISELQGDMNRVGEVVETISGELTAQKLKNSIEQQEAGDAFVPAMTAFHATATTTSAALKESLEQAMRLLEKTMKRFDKDPEEESPAGPASQVDAMPSAAVIASASEFFSTVYEFSVALSKADRDNEVKRVREEKRLKQQHQQKTQIPMRSHSSLDLLGRRRGLKAEGEAGPETPEKGKIDRADTNGSPLPARSSSMSAIAGIKTSDVVAAQSPLAAAKTSVSKMMSVAVKPAKASDTSNAIGKAGSAKKKAAGAATEAGKPPQHLRPPSTGKRDDGQPHAKDGKKDKVSKKSPRTILSTPGKIIRASKTVSAMSPLKSIMSGTSSNVVSPLKMESLPPSTDKSSATPRSVEKVVPFDGLSIGEIRSSLETKHGARASSHEGGSTSASKHRRDRETYDNNRSSTPEETTSEADTSASNLSLQIET